MPVVLTSEKQETGRGSKKGEANQVRQDYNKALSQFSKNKHDSK